MGDLARRHHFAPIFYLAGFTDDGTAEGRLHVLDKAKRRIWPSNPNDVGLEKDLYLIEDGDGQWTDAMELELARVESKLHAVLQQVITERRVPTQRRLLADLLRLVALLHFRTPAMKDKLNVIMQNCAVKLMAEHFNSGRLEQQVLREEGRVPTAEEMTTYRNATEAFAREDVTIEMKPNLWVDMMATAINKNGPHLAFHKWGLLCANNDAPDFISSDTPVTLSLRKPNLFQVGFIPAICTPHTWLVTPLNRRLVLIGSREGNHPRGPADASQVAFINKTILENAARFVYSTSREIAWKTGKKVQGTTELMEWLGRPEYR